MRPHSLVRAAACAALVLSSCAPDDPDVATATEEDAIYGPTTTNVDTLSSGFEGAVGALFNGGSRVCSATAVARNAIVTAKHCACGNSSTTLSFCLPQGGSGDRCATANGDEGFVSAVDGIVTHTPLSVWETCNSVQPWNGSSMGPDVMVLFLATPIPVSVLPVLPRVHLGNDLFAFALNESIDAGGLPVFFQAGFGGTAWKQSSGGGPRRMGQIGNDLHYEEASDVLDHVWFIEGDANDDPAALSTHSKGDSGGALFMQPMLGGTRVGLPYLVGVTSGMSEVAWDDDQSWAMTGSRWQDSEDDCSVRNSDVVRQALEPDEDQDGVLDFADNCPPSACPINANACANASQLDTDGDQVGDTCDVCDMRNDALGFGVPGPDGDHDGVGDVCDNCPGEPNSYQSDEEGDLVGDACDNCPENWNNYLPCTSNAVCAPGVCLKSTGGTNGHCSMQLDDSDGDGRGGICDSCPSNPADGEHEIFADSNQDMESELSVSRQGDVCDVVPQYVARPNLFAFEEQNDPCPVGAVTEQCRHVAKFFASSTIGSTSGSLTTFSAPVGFRHCDCYDASDEPLDREDCLATQCAILPSDYSNPSSAYRRISVGVAGATFPAYPASFTAPTFTNRNFNSSVADVDDHSHPDDQLEGDAELETWRVGPTQTIVWPWKSDVSLGYVSGHPAAVPVEDRKTSGIFWSIALPTTNAASRRDSSTDQRLRSVYTYVSTPLVAPPKPIYVGPWTPALPCFGGDCNLVLRPGLERINPPDFEFFDQFRTPMLLHAANGSAIISAGSRFEALRGSALVSAGVEAAIISGDEYFVSPVETERVTRTLGATIEGAFVPRRWTPSSTVKTLSFGGGKLGETAHANNGALVPAERTDYVALLATSEHALWLVGGINAWGDPNHELRRFDLDLGAWTNEIMDGAAVEHVIDAAYAPTEQRMVVIDRADTARGSEIRILAIDLIGGRTEILASYADTRSYERIAVSAEVGGSFVLLSSQDSTDTVSAFRFRVGRSGIEWVGEQTFSGTLLDGAQLTDDGVLFPMNVSGQQELPLITPRDLAGQSSGPLSF